MELQLMHLRKSAGYRSRDDMAAALGVNSRTYKTWETGERRLSLEQACTIADFLGCSLDELAGRWEYVGRFADKRQAAMNDAYQRLDEAGKDSAAASVAGIAAMQAREKIGQEGPEADERKAG